MAQQVGEGMLAFEAAVEQQESAAAGAGDLAADGAVVEREAVQLIDLGAGAMVKAGQVGQEAAVALRAELIVEAEELRRLGWQDVLSKD